MGLTKKGREKMTTADKILLTASFLAGCLLAYVAN